MLRHSFAVLIAIAIVVACGGQINGVDPGACTVPAGTYVEHFVPESPSCAAIADTSYTFNATTSFTVGDAGSTAPSAGCTATVDGPTCSVTYACTETSNGFTIQSNMTLVYKSDGTATGKVTEVVTGTNVNTTCTYDVTVSKG